MSATNRGAKRRESDYYPTPSWCTRRLFDALHRHGEPGRINHWVEPCAGDGAIIGASGIVWDKWITGDIEPRHELVPARGYEDTLAEIPPRGALSYAIVTNPPFGIADEIVRACVDRAGFVCVLLRLNWLAGAKRSKWLRGCPPDCVLVLPERPSFTGDGKTDATDYAWFMWDWTWDGDGVIILENTPIEERRRG